MGYNFRGLKPKSEKGKRFQMNNIGWTAILSIMFHADVDGGTLYEAEECHEVGKESAVFIADKLKENGSSTLTELTKEYEPLMKEFIEFCEESGGFEIS